MEYTKQRTISVDSPYILTSQARLCDPNHLGRADPPDILDRIEEFGPGTYVVTATCNGGQLRRAEFLIKSVTPKRRP